MAAEQQVVEVVADHIEEVAEVTRRINPVAVRYFVGGTVFGVALGFFFGYRFSREKIRAEVLKEAEEEISELREFYHQKMVALENRAEKSEMHSIIADKEYDEEDEPSPIESIQEPKVQAETVVIEERPLPSPVPMSPVKRVFRHVDNTKDKMEGWNFPAEMARRTADRPHIIHQDEFAHNESEYDQVTYIYYAGDDVLVDEDEQLLIDRDSIVGNGNLRRFGHGTDDFNILYVRNPVLELEIEICRHNGSYEEEVLGLDSEPENASEE